MRYTQPQNGPLTIDRGNPLGSKVIECIPLFGNRYSVVGNKPIAYGSGGSTIATPKGKALRGSGGGMRASLPLNLSKYSVITIAFTMAWDSYANDDAFAMEFTPNTNVNAGGFYIDPNSAASAFAVIANGSGSNGHGGTFLRPSAGVLHRYAITIDIVSQLITAWVDGVSQAISMAGGAITTGTTFASSTLNFFSRNGTDLLGTGTLQDLTIYAGTLSATEVAQDFANPSQIYASPARRFWATSAAPTGITASIAWAEDGDVSSVAGLLTNRIAAAWSETSETAALNAVISNRASISWVEGGESSTTVGVVTDRGALTWTEQGDTLAITGVAQQPAQASIQAAMAWTEASEISSLVARLVNGAALSIAEQGDSWALVAFSDSPPRPDPTPYPILSLYAIIGPAKINVKSIMRETGINLLSKML